MCVCVRERDWDLNSGDAPWNAAEKIPVSSANVEVVHLSRLFELFSHQSEIWQLDLTVEL